MGFMVPGAPAANVSLILTLEGLVRGRFVMYSRVIVTISFCSKTMTFLVRVSVFYTVISWEGRVISC